MRKKTELWIVNANADFFDHGDGLSAKQRLQKAIDESPDLWPYLDRIGIFFTKKEDLVLSFVYPHSGINLPSAQSSGNIYDDDSMDEPVHVKELQFNPGKWRRMIRAQLVTTSLLQSVQIALEPLTNASFLTLEDEEQAVRYLQGLLMPLPSGRKIKLSIE